MNSEFLVGAAALVWGVVLVVVLVVVLRKGWRAWRVIPAPMPWERYFWFKPKSEKLNDE